MNWFVSEKHFYTDESVKRQIADSISENSTDSDLESNQHKKHSKLFHQFFVTVKNFEGHGLTTSRNQIPVKVRVR